MTPETIELVAAGVAGIVCGLVTTQIGRVVFRGVRIHPVVLWGAGCVLCVVVALYGAANWNCHCNPAQPGTYGTAAQSAESWERYNQDVTERRRSAQLPFVFCVPMALGGLVGAVFCFAAVHHHWE